jgi:hypothetical protein
MKQARQVLWGLFIALASTGLILGGLSLSLAEGNILAPTQTLPPTATPTWAPFTPSSGTSAPAASATPVTPTSTDTPPPPPTSCPPPPGRKANQVQ